MFKIFPTTGRLSDNNLTASRPRIEWIDALKGFAILCVVVGHVVDGYIEAGTFPDSLGIENFIWQALYAFHMPLFFIVSGFVFSLAYANHGGSVKYAKLRTQLLDIAVVYIVFSAILVALKVMFAGHVNTQLSFTDLLHIWKSPISPYWYLYVLAAFYVVGVPLLIARCRLLVCSLIIALAVSLSSGWMGLPSAFCVSQMAFMLVFFIFGVAVQRGFIKIGWPIALAGLGLSVVLFCYFCDTHTPLSMAVRHLTFVNTIVAAGISLFIFKAFSAFAWLDSPFLRLCGKYCLGVYLIHCFFTAGFRTLLPVAGITAFWPSLLINTVLSTAISLLIPMTLARLGVHDIIFRPAHWLRRIRKDRQQ